MSKYPLVLVHPVSTEEIDNLFREGWSGGNVVADPMQEDETVQGHEVDAANDEEAKQEVAQEQHVVAAGMKEDAPPVQESDDDTEYEPIPEDSSGEDS